MEVMMSEKVLEAGEKKSARIDPLPLLYLLISVVLSALLILGVVLLSDSGLNSGIADEGETGLIKSFNAVSGVFFICFSLPTMIFFAAKAALASGSD